MNANGPLLDATNGIDLAHQLDLMVADGVDTIRVAFYWSAAQPYAKWSEVPSEDTQSYTDVGGVPTAFGATDRIVALAAARGLTVLPVVLAAPSWDARRNRGGMATPAHTGPYTDYLTALVRRYGSHGSFWKGRSRPVPVRRWQIWNEPNLAPYWPQPFATSYASLLRAADAAVKRADRSAQVVMGALTNYAWRALGQLMHALHGKRTFDVIAVNGFSSTPPNVVKFLRFVRQAADKLHLNTAPILATELGWTSSRSHGCRVQESWDSTVSGQAERDGQLVPLLAANARPLRLLGFYLITWMGDESSCSSDFNYAGLLRFLDGRVSSKPALSAFRHAALTAEGCRTRRRAGRCSS
jgi:hypothetical protein